MSGNHERPPVRLPSGQPRDGGDLVERLVRIADAGPAPAPEDTARLKQRLRPIWQREVRIRARRRLLWTAGALAAAAALVIVAGRALRVASPAPPAVATVVTIVGRADVTPLSGVRAAWGAAAAGWPLAAGTVVESGAGDRLALRLAGGESLRLDVGSRVRLDSAASVTLERGAAYVDSVGGAGIAVATALGEAREIGTQFEARLAAGALVIGVREGAVIVTAGGERLTVAAGTALTVTPRRAPERRPLAAWADEWQWTQAVAPRLDIEGRTASEYLAWAAREGGIEVAYADAGVERAAATAVLHGKLLGATPLESLAVVLPGCGLRFAGSGGRIVVSAVAPAPAPGEGR